MKVLTNARNLTLHFRKIHSRSSPSLPIDRRSLFRPVPPIPKRNNSTSDPDPGRQNLVLLEIDAATKVATITLNSPQTLNALSLDLGREFGAVTERLARLMRPDLDGSVADCREINAVVLAGAGRAFSSGGDLSWLRSRGPDDGAREGRRTKYPHVNADVMDAFYSLILRPVREILPVPVIAAVHGPAVGAGAALATACDVRVVGARRGSFGYNFVGIGLHPGAGCSHYLPAVVGHGPASRLLLGAETVSGEEARRIGLAMDVVDDRGMAWEPARESVLAKAREVAVRVAAASSVAVRTTTATLRTRQDWGLREALRNEAMCQTLCYSYGEDWDAGLDAIRDRRSPQFGPYGGRHSK